MRVIWLIGGTTQVLQQLDEILNTPVFGVPYLLRRSENLDAIPAEHLKDPGVVLLLDAFSPFHPGFEGLKSAREKNFKGKIFLFGEPAPEMAAQAIRLHSLTGYFPSFDRADLNFTAGVIHNSYYFDGDLNMMQFLRAGGRAAHDRILTLKDFNNFGTKLGAFVGRFGVDLAHVRKVLMGLSLGHVKTGVPGAQMDDSFVIHYGMDPHKIVLATTSLSKGASHGMVLQEFAEVVAELKNTGAPARVSMFPEMHHVARSAENMILICGSSKYESPSLDPMYLFTIIPFPGGKNQKRTAYYQFIYSHVRPTEEMDEVLANMGKGHQAKPQEEEAHAPHSVSISPEVTTLKPTELDQILAEPVAMDSRATDAKSSVPGQSEAAVNGPSLTETSTLPGEPGMSSHRQHELENEIEKLKAVCLAMGEDVKRLMKERRVPSTDNELREAYLTLEKRHKDLAKKCESLEQELQEKTSELALLKSEKKPKAA